MGKTFAAASKGCAPPRSAYRRASPRRPDGAEPDSHKLAYLGHFLPVLPDGPTSPTRSPGSTMSLKPSKTSRPSRRGIISWDSGIVETTAAGEDFLVAEPVPRNQSPAAEFPAIYIPAETSFAGLRPPPRFKLLILSTNETSGRSNSRVFSEACGGCIAPRKQKIVNICTGSTPVRCRGNQPSDFDHSSASGTTRPDLAPSKYRTAKVGSRQPPTHSAHCDCG
jgi:hypothetical protein